MAEKKLLLIAPSFAPYRAVRATSLAVYLAKHGYSVSVIRTMFTDIDAHRRITSEPQGLEYTDVFLATEGDFLQMEQAYTKAVKGLLEIRRFDVAIITLGPFYTYSITQLLREHGIPVVLDFRDLCVCEGLRCPNPLYLAMRVRRWQKNRKRELEAVRSATRIVTVVEDDRAKMLHWYRGKLSRSNITTIYNGYDGVSCAKQEPQRLHVPNMGDPQYFFIGVFGKLAYYDKHLARSLLKAVRKTAEKKVVIIHVGEKEEALGRILQQVGLGEEQYRYYGEIPYVDGMALMGQMHALCIVSCTTKGALGTKLFDYLYLNKPIIVLENRTTAITKLLQATTFSGGGYICKNYKEALRAIQSIIVGGITRLCAQGAAEVFAREAQYTRYCNLLEEVLCQSGAGEP